MEKHLSDVHTFAHPREVPAPERVRSQLASALDSMWRRLRLCRSQLGCEFRWFGRLLEENVFPAARKKRSADADLNLSVQGHGRVALIGTQEALPERFPQLCEFLTEIGIRSLELDTDLESNQVSDVLEVLWSTRRRLTGQSPRWWCQLLGRSAVFDALTSAAGLHISCAEARLMPQEGLLQVRNSYCPLTFSRAVTAYMQRNSAFRDHRAFFRAAPRYGVLAALLVFIPIVGALLLGNTPSLVLAIGFALALFVGLGMAVLFETIGAVEYDKEYQAKQLRERHEALRRAHERIQADLQRARRVQRMLVPAQDVQPFPDRLRVAHTFVPQMAVGGDYYDLEALPDGRLAILFADVSGHGMSSAFVTGIIKTIFELDQRAARPPQEFVSDVNRVLEQITPLDSFAAIVFASYDTADHTLTYTNAGHQPLPMIVRRSGAEIEHLDDAVGLVAGIQEETHYEQRQVSLQPGDKFILCTDGITESANPDGNRFGLSRLEEVLRSCPECPASDLPRQILEAVARHTRETPQEDDQTILVMEVLT